MNVEYTGSQPITDLRILCPWTISMPTFSNIFCANRCTYFYNEIVLGEVVAKRTMFTQFFMNIPANFEQQLFLDLNHHFWDQKTVNCIFMGHLDARNEIAEKQLIISMFQRKYILVVDPLKNFITSLFSLNYNWN